MLLALTATVTGRWCVATEGRWQVAGDRGQVVGGRWQIRSDPSNKNREKSMPPVS